MAETNPQATNETPAEEQVTEAPIETSASPDQAAASSEERTWVQAVVDVTIPGMEASAGADADPEAASADAEEPTGFRAIQLELSAEGDAGASDELRLDPTASWDNIDVTFSSSSSGGSATLRIEVAASSDALSAEQVVEIIQTVQFSAAVDTVASLAERTISVEATVDTASQLLDTSASNPVSETVVAVEVVKNPDPTPLFNEAPTLANEAGSNASTSVISEGASRSWQTLDSTGAPSVQDADSKGFNYIVVRGWNADNDYSGGHGDMYQIDPAVDLAGITVEFRESGWAKVPELHLSTPGSSMSAAKVNEILSNIQFSSDSNPEMEGVSRLLQVMVKDAGDLGGNRAEWSSPFTMAIDFPAPSAPPEVRFVDLGDVLEDSGPVTFSSAQLLAGSSDVNGDALSLSAVELSDPAAGSLVANADGTWTFSPAENFAGGDVSINFVVSDGAHQVAGSAGLSVLAVNDAPTLLVGASQTATDAASADTLVVGSIAIDSMDVEGLQEFRINTHTQSQQTDPSISAFENGGFVVTWESQDAATGDEDSYGISARMYLPTGEIDDLGQKVYTASEEFLVNTYMKSYQGDPTVTALHDAAGNDSGFVITWFTEDKTTGDDKSAGIAGQIFDMNGAKVGDEFLVNQEIKGAQALPQVTALNNGGFAIAWESANKDDDISVRIFDGNGSALTDDFAANTDDKDPKSEPAITTLADGSFVVVWEVNNQVMGQRFSADGERWNDSTEFFISASDSNQNDPSIAALADGGFVVTWQGVTPTDNSGIAGRVFDSNGNAKGAAFSVNTFTKAGQVEAAVAGMDDGGFVVTWTSANAPGDDIAAGISGQYFDADGNTLGGEFGVNQYTQAEQSVSDLTALGDGAFIVTWATLDRTTGDESSRAVVARTMKATPTVEYVGGEGQAGDEVDTNLLLMLDVSGSMDRASGDGEKRIDAMKVAVNELIAQYEARGDVAVKVVAFADGATVLGDFWEGADAAQKTVSKLHPSGLTNYDAAAEAAVDTAWIQEGKVAGGQNVAYFVSDGAPTVGEDGTILSAGLNGPEEAAWTDFLAANGVRAFAIGVGDEVDLNALEPLAYDGLTGLDTGAVTSSFADLSDTLATLDIETFGVGPAKLVSESLSIADVDSGTLSGATVSIVGGFTSGDTLAFKATKNVKGKFDKETGTLELSGEASLAEYESALRSVRIKGSGFRKSQVERDVEIKVNDGENESAAIVHTVQIELQNTAATAGDVDLGVIAEDTTLTFGALQLLAASSDVDGDALSVTSVRLVFPSPGAVTQNADGTWTYEPPADFNGEGVTFEFQVSDGQTEMPAVASLDVLAVNDGPVVGDVDLGTVDEDASVTFQEKELLAMSSDVEGDDLSITQVALLNPGAGALAQNPNGSWTFTPTADFNGSDVALSFVVSDGQAQSVGTAVIDVNAVNDASVLSSPASSSTAYRTVSIGAGEINPGDTNLLLILDVSGSMGLKSFVGELSRLELMKESVAKLVEKYESAGDVAVQIVTFNSDASTFGEVWVTSGEALASMDSMENSGLTNFDAALVEVLDTAWATDGKIPGAQNVSYFVSDGEPNRTQGSIGIDQAEENVWTAFLQENGIRGYALGMGNKTSGDQLNAIAFDGVSGENLAAVEVTDFAQLTNVMTGVDTQSFGPAGSVVLFEDLTVQDIDSPTLQGATVTIAEGFASGDLLTFDTLGNISGTFDPIAGTLVLEGEASVAEYQTVLRSVTFEGPGVFNSQENRIVEFSVNDGESESNISTVGVIVALDNFAPNARSVDLGSTAEETAITFDSADLLRNSTDTNSDALSVSELRLADPSQGILETNPDGTWTFTPATDFTGDATFAFVITDGQFTDHSSASIAVTPVNDAPNAGDDSVVVSEDSSIVINVLDNDTDVDGTLNKWSVEVQEGPQNGEIWVSQGQVSYKPNADFAGNDSFAYVVRDDQGAVSNAARVSVLVEAANEAPQVGIVDLGAVDEDASVLISAAELLAASSDRNGDALTVTSLTLDDPSVGILQANPDATWTFTPTADFSGQDLSLSFSVSDGQLASYGNAVIDVTPVNDASILTPVDSSTTFSNTVSIGASNFKAVDTNLLLILDVSGSMENESGIGTMSRLAMLQDAVTKLIGQYETAGELAVKIVTFSTDANTIGETWVSAADARGTVAELGHSGLTNFDAALNQVLNTAWDQTGKIAGAQNVSYFLSDGEPNRPLESAGIDSAEEAVWTGFLDVNDIRGFALGMGGESSDIALHPIAFDGVAGVDTAASVVTDFAQLENVVLNLDAETFGSQASVVLFDDLVITDIDSSALQGATVRIAEGFTAGDELSFQSFGGISGQFNPLTGELELSGAASIADYQAALRSVQFTGTGIHESSADRFVEFVVTDGSAESNVSSVTVSIELANQAPNARDVELPGCDEGASVTLTSAELLLNSTDPEGDVLSVTNVQLANPAEGSIVDNGDGTWTVFPVDGTGGGDLALQFTVSDGNLSDMATATLAIGKVDLTPGINELPQVALDTPDGISFVNYQEGADRSWQTLSDAGALEMKDSDSDSFWWVAVIGNQGADTNYSNGKGDLYRLDPALEQSGYDIDFRPSASQPSIWIRGAGGRQMTADEVNEVLGALQFSADSNPGFEGATRGLQVYVQDAGDMLGNDPRWSSPLSVKIGPNVAPVAEMADLGTINEDSSLFIRASQLLAATSDADGDHLTVTSVELADTNAGSLRPAGTGVWEFTPAENFNGNDIGFTYTVTDGKQSDTSLAFLDIAAINDAPVAGHVDLGAMKEDGVRIIQSSELLANSSDLDGDALSVWQVTYTDHRGSGSTLVPVSANAFEFRPGPDYHGQDLEFVFVVTDGTDFAQTTAVLDVESVNDAPVVNLVDLGQIPSEGSLVIRSSDLLGRSTDVDGDLLTVTNLSLVDATAGLLVQSAPGEWTFTAAQGFTGENLSMNFSVSDGLDRGSNVAVFDVMSGAVEIGTEGNDTLVGTELDDAMLGNAGDDDLSGGRGNDILDGGAGVNVLTGGEGHDQFVFKLTDGHAKHLITDFSLADGDMLDIRDVLPDAVAGSDPVVLDRYLHFAKDSDGNTVVLLGENMEESSFANPGSDPAPVIQHSITLQGVDLQGGSGTTDMDIINNLMAGGNLLTEHH